MYGLIPKRMFSPLGSLDKDFFKFPWSDFKSLTAADFKIDIQEKDDSYLLNAELPGCDKNNIDVKAENGVITITASRHEEVNEEKNNYIHKETFSGSISRQIFLENIDEDQIAAKYENGVLSLRVPKKQTNKEKRILIE